MYTGQIPYPGKVADRVIFLGQGAAGKSIINSSTNEECHHGRV
jgi:hypothetical protein